MTFGGDIHPTAIVSPGAKLGEGTKVGPYAIIGDKVEVGRDNTIGAHVVLDGLTKIGNDNEIFPFASIGLRPQDLKYRGEPSTLEIGDRNVIREYVTMQPGTEGGGMVTRVGSNNLFMANSHVGHDCIVGDRNIVANSVGLSGHVTLENGVIVGGLSGIHQFVKLGSLSFIGGGGMVTQDVPPFCVAQGDRAQLAGLNQLGLERNGFNSDDIKILRKVYRAIFLRAGVLREKLAQAKSEFSGYKGVSDLIEFIESSKRGVCFHRSKNRESSDQ